MKNIEGADHLQADETQSAEDKGGLKFTIEPTTGGSVMDSLDKGKETFSVLLKSADLRSLVQYLMQAGADIEKLPGIPSSLRKAFASRDFKHKPYTWRNPKIYLLADRIVLKMTLSELLARIRERDAAIQDLLS